MWPFVGHQTSTCGHLWSIPLLLVTICRVSHCYFWPSVNHHTVTCTSHHLSTIALLLLLFVNHQIVTVSHYSARAPLRLTICQLSPCFTWPSFSHFTVTFDPFVNQHIVTLDRSLSNTLYMSPCSSISLLLVAICHTSSC